MIPFSSRNVAILAVAALWSNAGSHPCIAQGYVSENGRNHPEISWLVAETEHFSIVYPSHIAGVEVEAAAVAEETYDVLAENLGIEFDSRIRIYLSDEDEIVNGFAVPVGAGHTNIWVHLNDALEVWTGREKWIRKVVAHELAHIFHYRAIRTPFRPFDLSLALPRFWTEGLAQYQTEDWDAYRGERWLRTAVLDDRLSYTDGRSLWNGRLLYSVGNAQVRYFASEYGDSSLVKLLRQRRTVFPGVRIHDFGHAFRRVTGISYREFYDDWRRHVNVLYNTIAGQMENVDSLGATPMNVPGQYVRSLAVSADGSTIAAVVVHSIERPIEQLLIRRPNENWRVLVNGQVLGPISVAPAGDRIAYVRRVRGEHGSLVNDLFEVNTSTGGRRRLTYSRRASYPSYSPDGLRLAFAGSEHGTGNVFVLDLVGGAERQITHFSGDNQVAHAAWHPSKEWIAYSRFDAGGDRFLEVVDVESGESSRITDAAADDRGPIWSPDGDRVAFTSLRDGVPNVFTTDLGNDASHGVAERATALATGGDAYAWLPADSTSPRGRIAVRVGVSKTADKVFLVDAARTFEDPTISVPAGYEAWQHHRPPREVSLRAVVEPGTIVRRRRYNSLTNITHVATFAFPYYGSADNYGVAAFTAWTEPLGKHSFGFVVGASIPDFVGKTSFRLAYVNNQFRPLLQTVVERLPDAARPYGSTLLRESSAKVSFTVRWPVSLTTAPYTRSTISLRTRYVTVDPHNLDDFEDEPLPTPEAGHQVDSRLTLRITKQSPYRHNVVHPLDGYGVRLRAMGALRSFSRRTGFLRFGLAAYAVVPGVGSDRFFVYGRVQHQRGQTLPQNFIGLSRYDEFQVTAPDVVEITFSDLDRVRGYRRAAVGRSVWFGSLEYRVPVAPSLQTRILGLVSLGASTISLFADGGLVYPEYALRNPDRRLGVGVELKNAVTIGGLLTIMHAVGVAQQAGDVGTDQGEVYYRIRAAVPF